MNRTILALIAVFAVAMALIGCQTATKQSAGSAPDAAAGPFDKPGFNVEVDDGRLWVLKPGEEKSGKHVTLIGAGPQGKTVRALQRDSALEYLAAKPGFQVEVDDGRLWVLKPGQDKSGKYITLVGAGPQNRLLVILSGIRRHAEPCSGRDSGQERRHARRRHTAVGDRHPAALATGGSASGHIQATA